MNRTLIFAAVAIALTPLAADASGMKDALRDSFNGTANVTGPGAIVGPSGGVVTGGSITARSQISNIDIVGFQPGSMSGGCGGVDINSPSMSFIGGDALVNAAKNVASNAKYLLFDMGLKAVSAQLSGSLQSAMDKVQDLNLEALNSCKIAEAITAPVNSRVNAFVASRQQQNGAAQDRSDAENPGSGRTPVSVAPSEARAIEGNATWNALSNADVAVWLGSDGASSRTLREQVMSVAGTVITCADPKAKCGLGGAPAQDGQTSAQQARAVGIVRLADLVLSRPEGQGGLTYYRCTDGDRCLGLETATDTSFVPLGTQIREVLVGADGNGGMLARQRINGGEGLGISDEELALTNSATELVSLATALNGCGRYSEAVRFAMKYSDLIAAQLVYRDLQAVLNNVEVAVSAQNLAHGDAALTMLGQRKEALASEYAAISASMGGLQDMIRVAEANTRSCGARLASGPVRVRD